MAGPFGVIRIHDTRDWAQRLPTCHDFFSHRQGLFRDALWNLNCRFDFESPPTFSLEPETKNNRLYRFLESTWMLQQIPLAAIFYALGGWPWVIWGISVRIVLGVAGHWTITYVTHNSGPGKWYVPDAGVQASNLPGWGLLTMGECWHNNHHAFPESAQIGLDHQFDPGWITIKALEKVGLAWNIGRPRKPESRADLTAAASGQIESLRDANAI